MEYHFRASIEFHSARTQWNHGFCQRNILFADVSDKSEHLGFRMNAIENLLGHELGFSAQVSNQRNNFEGGRLEQGFFVESNFLDSCENLNELGHILQLGCLI